MTNYYFFVAIIAISFFADFGSTFLIRDNLPPVPDNGGKLWVVLAAGKLGRFELAKLFYSSEINKLSF